MRVIAIAGVSAEIYLYLCVSIIVVFIPMLLCTQHVRESQSERLLCFH